MIKIDRRPAPVELTNEKVQELTAKYITDRRNAVWNQSYIRSALLSMSHNKCVYCETRVDEEAKYMEIDHYFCKGAHPNEVVAWNNLVPSCKRCNVNKGSYDVAVHGSLIDPTIDDPADHLSLINFRFRGRDAKGKRAIEAIYLNDTNRVVRARFDVGSSVSEAIEKLVELAEECISNPGQARKVTQLERGVFALLEETRPSSEYSATAATIVASHPDYIGLRQALLELGRWTQDFESLELQMQTSALNR
jgi:uncharacterized protein (TIGR02646 family)